MGLTNPYIICLQPLYTVRFRQSDLWEQYAGLAKDTLDLEIYQPWLELATEADYKAQAEERAALAAQLEAGKD